MENFLPYLTLILIALLFADKYVPALLNKFFGIKTNGKNNHYQEQIDELKKHASKANDEMGEIKTDIAVIKTKLESLHEDIKEIKTNVCKKE